MNFFKRATLKKRMYSLTESSSPMSPISSVLEDIEDDEIDYSPIIQQEAAGIRLQKIERMMIEEKIQDCVRWSTEHKKWAEKYRRLLKAKDSSFQPYTTTLHLFQVSISQCDQIAVQLDESTTQLEKLLKDIPKHENRSIKSQLTQESSTVKEIKSDLDVLEKERCQAKSDLKQTRKNLASTRLNTKKHDKLQERQESLVQKCKQLKGKIERQQETYRQAQKQCRANTENIFQQSQKKELERLQNMQEPLKNFMVALKLDSTLVEKAMQKHSPKTDLISWKEKHFSSSFSQTSV